MVCHRNLSDQHTCQWLLLSSKQPWLRKPEDRRKGPILAHHLHQQSRIPGGQDPCKGCLGRPEVQVQGEVADHWKAIPGGVHWVQDVSRLTLTLRPPWYDYSLTMMTGPPKPRCSQTRWSATSSWRSRRVPRDGSATPCISASGNLRGGNSTLPSWWTSNRKDQSSLLRHREEWTSRLSPRKARTPSSPHINIHKGVTILRGILRLSRAFRSSALRTPRTRFRSCTRSSWRRTPRRSRSTRCRRRQIIRSWAMDAKLNFDNNAKFRQKEISSWRDKL